MTRRCHVVSRVMSDNSVTCELQCGGRDTSGDQCGDGASGRPVQWCRWRTMTSIQHNNLGGVNNNNNNNNTGAGVRLHCKTAEEAGGRSVTWQGWRGMGCLPRPQRPVIKWLRSSAAPPASPRPGSCHLTAARTAAAAAHSSAVCQKCGGCSPRRRWR